MSTKIWCQEPYIRTTTTAIAKGYASRSNKISWRTLIRHRFLRSRKKMVRLGLVSANVAVLAIVVVFILNAPTLQQSLSAGAISDPQSVSGPLDQLSSADIAVNVARIANLAEAASVVNHADSVNAQLTSVQTEEQVIEKPIIASAPLPSRRDIKTYVVKAGDNLNNVAAANGISSDSLKWSNSLTSGTLVVGTTLYLPPSGVNGIVYIVKAGDTPENLAQKYNANKDLITAFNDAEVAGLKVGDRILIPNGSIIAPRPSFAYAGFAFGAAAKYGYNGYDYGWCTWYVANRRTELGRPVPANLGNAYSWYYLAQRAGLATGLTPAPGAVAVNQGGNHVSVVEVVNPDGSFWVSEMNSRGQGSIENPTPTGGWGVRDYKLYTSPGNLKFVY